MFAIDRFYAKCNIIKKSKIELGKSGLRIETLSKQYLEKNFLKNISFKKKEKEKTNKKIKKTSSQAESNNG